MKEKKRISRSKAILRYPGGKFKAVKFIQPFWEQVEHDEYREPFVGGGSVFISKPLVKFNWINDINKELFALYKSLADNSKREKLISELLSIEITKGNYDKLFYSKPKDWLGKAKRYYVLNRCSFSGITKWNSFIGDVRYNIEQAQHLMRDVGRKLAKTKITCEDFEKVIIAKPLGSGKVFMFLDPPYAESRQEAAYEHSFTKEDHVRLANLLKKTKYSFLLTYDDCPFIRELYEDWTYLYPRTWTYSVANVKTHWNPRESGNELFISNFPLKKIENKKITDFDIIKTNQEPSVLLAEN